MKEEQKTTFIGTDKNRERGFVLFTDKTFDEIQEHISWVTSEHFRHKGTDWGGRDNIERALELLNIQLTGREIILETPIIYSGHDYDMGHEYP